MADVMRPTLAADSLQKNLTQYLTTTVRGPPVAADSLKKTLTQYLTTTFGLSEANSRGGLEAFLTHPERGISRGPSLRTRTPFRPADGDWRSPLEWAPAGFSPYLHQ